MDETIVAVVTRRSVAISRSASQNASSRLILVLCPATTIDRLRTRDFCLWPSMKQHPITVAPVRYNRKIGEPRNHLCVCKELVRLGPSGRPHPNWRWDSTQCNRCRAGGAYPTHHLPRREMLRPSGRDTISVLRCPRQGGFSSRLAELVSGGDGGDGRDCRRRPPPSGGWSFLMQEKRDSEAGGRNNRDRYQHNDDKPIFFAHRSRPRVRIRRVARRIGSQEPGAGHDQGNRGMIRAIPTLA